MAYRLFVTAGEVSGDRHAGALIEALRARVGPVEVRGLGGEAMERAGATLLERVDRLSVLGFAEVARRLPFFLRLLRRVQDELLSWKPNLLLPVDYPGFNLRLARYARRKGIRVAYYIAPQVWAWRRDRRPGIRRAVDHLLVVFPFEEPLFREAGIPTTFVGHPLLDREPGMEPRDLRTELGVEPGRKLLALLPGSREQEVHAILPRLLEGTQDLSGRGVALVVSRAPGLSDGLYRDAEAAGIRTWRGDIASLARAADGALVASGTATLETGLAGTPLAVVYRTGAFNWHVARALVRPQAIGLVNIAAGGERVPELLQGECNPARVRRVAEKLLFDPLERKEQEAYLRPLRERLGGGGAAERAADVVATMLESGR